MGKLTIDLGAILGTTGQKTPEANPYFGTSVDPNDPSTILGPDGKPIDDKFQVDGEKYNSKYDPTQRFTPLSDWSAAFHPEVANYVAKSNTDYQQAQTIAQRQHDISQGIVAKDVGSVRNLAATPVTDPSVSDTQAAILLGNNPSAAGFNATLGNQADIAAGVPRLTAEQQASIAALNREKADSQRRILGGFTGSGGEGKEILGQLNQLDVGNADAAAHMYNLPAATRNTALTLGNQNEYQSTVAHQLNQNESVRASNESIILPIQYRGLIARAQAEAGQNEQSLKDLPYTTYAQGMRAIGEANNSNYQVPFGSPIMTRINPEGTVDYNQRVPYAGIMDTMNAKMGSGVTPTKQTTYTTTDGKVLPPPMARSTPVIRGSSPIIQQTRVPAAAINTPSTTQEHSINQEESPLFKGNSEEEKPKVDQVPLNGRAGYTIDGDGNIYYEGQKVKMVAGSDIKEEAKQQLQEMERQNLFKQYGINPSRRPVASGNSLLNNMILNP